MIDYKHYRASDSALRAFARVLLIGLVITAVVLAAVAIQPWWHQLGVWP